MLKDFVPYLFIIVWGGFILYLWCKWFQLNKKFVSILKRKKYFNLKVLKQIFEKTKRK